MSEKIRRIKVKLGARSYTMAVGALAKSAGAIAKLSAGRDCLIVTDSNVAAGGHLDPVCELFADASRLGVATLKPGEKYKTFAAAEGICSFAAHHAYDRNALFIALGGGVVGDLTGFAAGIYKRGVDCVQVPTTLLAMVDSSIGGKTGADLPEGKNLIGLFHQPRAVFADPAMLSTLPKAELRNGLAEIIKYAVIRDRGLFDLLWERRTCLLKRPDFELYSQLIARCGEIKAQVVSADEAEHGERAILNFGHSFGHAVEHLSAFRIRHGAAVGYGMALAGRLARRMGMFDSASLVELQALLDYVNLPLESPVEADASIMLEAMRGDKKNYAGKFRLVLPERIGSVKIVGDVPEKELEAFLRDEL